MKRRIETSIEIQAPAAQISKILKDSDAYSEWNPFIRSVKGSFVPGMTVRVEIAPPGGAKMAFSPMVLKSDSTEIRWRGKLLIKGLFDGEHYFRLEPISDTTTRFVHGEEFSGIAVRFLQGTLEKTQEGFTLMNRALKERAESLS